MRGSAKRASYEGLRKLVRGLRAVASGEVLDRALAKASRYMEGRVKGELSRHTKGTGLAASTARVAVDSKTLGITLQRYYRHIKWSWKKGIPKSALDRVIWLVAVEYEKAMKGKV